MLTYNNENACSCGCIYISMWVQLYQCVCMCVYIYIYIYIYKKSIGLVSLYQWHTNPCGLFNVRAILIEQ